MLKYKYYSAHGAIVTLCIAVGVSGCITYPEKEDFGDAVRHMHAVQDATPETEGFAQDGLRGQNVLKVFREDVAKPSEVKNEIVINVGSEAK